MTKNCSSSACSIYFRYKEQVCLVLLTSCKGYYFLCQGFFLHFPDELQLFFYLVDGFKDKRNLVFTESAHWSNSVSKSQCPCSSVCVCPCHLGKPASWRAGEFWCKSLLLIREDEVFSTATTTRNKLYGSIKSKTNTN